MGYYNKLQLINLKAFTILGFISFMAISANAQKGERTMDLEGITERSGVAYDFQDVEESEINILKTFLHSNHSSFSITIYDFKDEKVKVLIYDVNTQKRLYSLNVTPNDDIYNVELLTTPLPKGTYHILVKGESRVIPKQMTIN
jgi:hypothetical protein